MSYAETALPEFDHEMAGTRKVLERIPDDKLDWQRPPQVEHDRLERQPPGRPARLGRLDHDATRLRLRPRRRPALPNAIAQNDQRNPRALRPQCRQCPPSSRVAERRIARRPMDPPRRRTHHLHHAPPRRHPQLPHEPHHPPPRGPLRLPPPQRHPRPRPLRPFRRRLGGQKSNSDILFTIGYARVHEMTDRS